MTGQNGYDAHEREVGRPQRIYLPQRYWQWLRFVADEKGLPLTRVLSDIVADFVAKHGEFGPTKIQREAQELLDQGIRSLGR